MADEDRRFATNTVQAPDRTATATTARRTQVDVSAPELDDAIDDDDEAPGLDADAPASLAQEANPEEDWGEPGDEGTVFSSNNTRRGVRAEAERSQGTKTRQHNKDIFSRRT